MFAPPDDEMAAPALVPTTAPPDPMPDGAQAGPSGQPTNRLNQLEALLQSPAQLGEAQARDTMLDATRRLTAVSESQVVDERRAGRRPRIVAEKGVWYREIQGWSTTPMRQILLSMAVWGAALEAVHDHLWAGHQGVKNTLQRLEK